MKRLPLGSMKDDFAKTPEAAQERHDRMEHFKNTGHKTWRTCTAIACEAARWNIGMDKCPMCHGAGYVLAESK